jgi:hypothetical protein
VFASEYGWTLKEFLDQPAKLIGILLPRIQNRQYNETAVQANLHNRKMRAKPSYSRAKTPTVKVDAEKQKHIDMQLKFTQDRLRKERSSRG